MIELRISEAAAVAIVEQSDYYQNASGTALALRWETAVDQAVKSLLSLPERGSLCRFRLPSLARIRWIIIPGFPSHLVFYRFFPHEQTLLIVHVLHGARDLETILNENPEEPPAKATDREA